MATRRQKIFDDMFIRFDRIHERDGHTHTHTHTQTDRRIPNDDIARACIASRGKNEYAVFGLDGDGECRRPTVGDYAEPNV